MKLHYLTDNSNKTLTPFFAPSVLAGTYYMIVTAGILVIVFWPWQDLSSFLIKPRAPLLFFAVFAVALCISAYMSLRCGRGELFSGEYYSGVDYHQEVSTHEKEYGFFQYALIEFLLHTTLMLMPLLPIFLLVAAVSGLPWIKFGQALSMVFTAALFCRLFGFCMYLVLGRGSTIGHILSRIFLTVFLFVTPFVASTLNPLLPLYDMNRGLPEFEVLLTSSYRLYMATVLAGIVALVMVNALLVWYARSRTTGIEDKKG